MKRIFSGAQPTGNVHLGNYLGALRNWVALQHDYESFFCIVNLHAITVPQDPKVLAAKTRELGRIYLAVGIDPNVSTVFVQSDVAAHTELTWLLNGVARIGELERMTQFKDKAVKQAESLSVGYFDYPVLMASDILLYQTDLVPVGEDQKQHLELTRDLAIRFNRDYGQTFAVPEPFIPKVGARIMSLADPAKKMSKSDEESEAGCIMLLDDEDAVRRKFKRAVTDSGTEIRFEEGRPAINNLLTIYHLLTGKSAAEIEDHFRGKGYAALKQELADVCIEFLKPIQERVRGIDDDKLNQILEQGAERAEGIARMTLNQAKEKHGAGRRPKLKMEDSGQTIDTEEAATATETAPTISVAGAQPSIASDDDGDQLKVTLGDFEGPLDLLLYLIRQEQVNIYDIPVARITDEYLRYLKLMKELDLTVAGDFLVMAAQLIELKSRMLLPRDPLAVEEEIEDPRNELVNRLLEHEKFKAAAQMLWSRATVEQAVFRRAEIETDKNNPEVAVGLFDLLRVFQEILTRHKEEVMMEIEREEVTMAEMIERLRNMVRSAGELNVLRFFEQARSRRELVVAFLSVLELVRLSEILLKQSETFGEITARAAQPA